MTTVPEQGQLISVRSRQWIVTDVRPSTLPTPALKPTFSGPQNPLTLASVEDDGLGEALQVIWELELDSSRSNVPSPIKCQQAKGEIRPSGVMSAAVACWRRFFQATLGTSALENCNSRRQGSISVRIGTRGLMQSS